MSNSVLEAVGILFGLTALGCLVGVAFTVSNPIGVLALAGAFGVVSFTLIVIANTRKPPVPGHIRNRRDGEARA